MKRAPTALAALTTALLLASGVPARSATMDQLWPHDDGRSWKYDLHFESYDSSPQVADLEIRLLFDGTTVAPDGIAAQYLRQQTVGAPQPTTALALSVPDPFLRQVWAARPDLRQRILSLASASPCPQFAPPDHWAVLLGGEFAWLETAGEIAAWRCNATNTRSWQWLVSDLSIGNTFTLQLLPDLATDIYLHGTIAAVEPFTVPGGTFQDCVRVDYVVDYGTSQCTDDQGNVTGTSRAETRGHVHYAPLVGPVECSEAFVVVEATGACGAVGTYSATSLRLNTQPVPVVPTTWGRIKAAYR